MRIRRTLVGLTCLLALAGCGAEAPSGKVAADAIEADWEGVQAADNVRWPAGQDFSGTTVDATCAAKPDAARRVRCALTITDSKGSRVRHANALVTFSKDGTVKRWDFVR